MFVMSKMSFRRATVGAVIAIMGLLITMSPAWAHGTGVTTNGASNVDETGNPTDGGPLCLEATGISINLYNTGGFNDQPGPFKTKASFSSGNTFYFGPTGTFSDSECELEAPVTGTLEVSRNGVSCGPVGAEYKRVGNEYEIRTTGDPNCTVAGTSGDDDHALTFTGTQQACGPIADPCDPLGTPNDDSDDVEFTGVYQQG